MEKDSTTDEEMDMGEDNVDGFRKRRKARATNGQFRNVDQVNQIEDTPDILIPPSMTLGGQTEGHNLPSTSNETSDSKKLWESITRRFKGRGENPEGPFASCDPYDFEYNMEHKHRGHVIIFNHSDFDPSQGLEPRPGSNKDASDLKSTFEQLDFIVDIFNDLKFSKMYAVLDQASRDDHKDEDCIVIIVLTHGKYNILHAYDHSFKPETLWSFFTADKCASLAGKPKLFFIQACRGEEYDEGTTLLPSRHRTVVDGPGHQKPYRIPNQADFLMVFSTAPACRAACCENLTVVQRLFQCLSLSSGHFSWRNSVKGGCFVQALCKTLDKYAWHMDILSLMTIVNREVAINYESNVPRDVTLHQKKQVPNVSHTLTRQVRFLPKNQATGTLV